MSSSGKSVLIDVFPRSAFRHRRRDAVVCVDVMMATTTLVSAVHQGRRAFVAATEDEARTLAATKRPAVVAGSPELGGRVRDSPIALEADDSRTLVLVSPPGTELISHCAGARTVLVACFRNVAATVSHLARGFDTVAILAAGCRQEFSCEDQMAAAWMADALSEHGFQPEDRRTADVVRRWRGIEPSMAALGNSAAHLRRSGLAADVEFVLDHVNDVPLACASTAAGVHAVAEDAAFDHPQASSQLGAPGGAN